MIGNSLLRLQPQQFYEVDWSGIAQHLDYVWLFRGLSDKPLSWARNGPPVSLSPVGSIATKAFFDGVATSLPGSNDNGYTLSQNVFTNPPCSIFWGDVGQTIAAGSGVVLTETHNQGASTGGLHIRIGNAAEIAIVQQNTAYTTSVVCRNLGQTNYCGVTISANVNGRHATFANGFRADVANPTVTYKPRLTSRIGDQGSVGGYVPLSSGLYYLFFAADAVPDWVALELVTNPYQIFGRRQRLWICPPAPELELKSLLTLGVGT